MRIDSVQKKKNIDRDGERYRVFVSFFKKIYIYIHIYLVDEQKNKKKKKKKEKKEIGQSQNSEFLSLD